MRFGYRKLLVLVGVLVGAAMMPAQESFHGSFAEPADGGNLDVVHSTFDGDVAYLVPRGHESEALGAGSKARRWRNMLFAIRGVKGKIVTFHLPARPVETGDLVHNLDTATLNLIEPVWSYEAAHRDWVAFDSVDTLKPDGANALRGKFPNDSVADNSGRVPVGASSPRRDDYGWVFRNRTPFTEDVVYISINEQYPVLEFYDWIESKVLPHAWVQPTASEVKPGTALIGYQSGGRSETGAFSREIPDTPLYAFQIRDPRANPTKVVMLVSGQHPYEGQTKAVLQAAIEWILDPNDPAAAAYRSEYVTLVYPFVNPTGERAGIWRGTAFDPRRDINRNWNTSLTDPTADRGIDTVIIHKQAMLRDLAALGLGAPYAMVDLHQNYGDQLPALHYVLHNRNALATAYMGRLQQATDIADIISNPFSSQTLRGYWQFAGAAMTLCIERSTYSTLGAERVFGRELMRAFVPGANILPTVVETPAETAVAAPVSYETSAGSVAAEGSSMSAAEAPTPFWSVAAGSAVRGPAWVFSSERAPEALQASAQDDAQQFVTLSLSASGFAGADQPK